MRVLFLLLGLVVSTGVFAHPLDEFCDDGGLDPLLCAELSQLDAEAAPAEVQVFLDRSPGQTAAIYIGLGWEHILPWGLDHLAFVIALLLVAGRWQRAVGQISLFTAAHTVTIFLSSFGLVRLNSQFVEVAIAVSIVFVAVENLIFKRISQWRYLLVFVFGLLHGLGFAGALAELGVPEAHFILAILGFNLGVELGQLAFAAGVFILLTGGIKRALQNEQVYQRAITLPASLFIALVASWWTAQRLIF